MKTFFKHLSIQLFILLSIGVGYAAWNTLVVDGETLTATKWNDIVNQLTDVTTDVGNLSFSGGKVGVGKTPISELDVSGTISADSFDMTFERVTNTITAVGNKTVSVSCNAGYTVTGGGCQATAWGGEVVQSYPNSNGWSCSTKDSYGTAVTTTVYAVCVKTS